MNAIAAITLGCLALAACLTAFFFVWKSLRDLLLGDSKPLDMKTETTILEDELDNYVEQAQDLAFDLQEGKLSEQDFKDSNHLIKTKIAKLMKQSDQDLGPYRERAKKLIEQGLLVFLFALSANHVAAQDNAVMQRFFGESEPLVLVQDDASVPAGTVVIRVLSPSGEAQAVQDVRLGSLGKAGERKEFFCTTDASGICAIKNLPTGETQAFRLTSNFEGALYASTPFRLGAESGAIGLVQLRKATTDTRYVFQAFGALFFEYENNKSHVSQHVELVNMSDSVFLFPDAGLSFNLPAQADKFESDPSMSQITLQKEGNRVILKGSLPPGRVILDWGFELPRSAVADATFKFPFVTLEYDIATDYARGVELSAVGFPPAAMDEREDRVVLATRRWTHPGASEAYDLHLKISGLTAHLTLKLILFAVACLIFAAGIFVVVRRKRSDPAQQEAAEQQRIIAQARELHRQKQNGEIGPEYFASQEQDLIDELAALLRAQEISQKPA